MKFRSKFVSNSSSCSFIVTNKTSADLDYSELVRDLKSVVQLYLSEYEDIHEIKNYNGVIESAKRKKYIFKAKSNVQVEFGDNHGDFMEIVGAAVDYFIKETFESDRFYIEFKESLH